MTENISNDNSNSKNNSKSMEDNTMVSYNSLNLSSN